VYWGERGPGKKGRLLGLATGNSGAIIDFAEQIGIYVLYNDPLQIMYVGQAGGRNDARIIDRLRTHTRDHLAQLWTRFSWFGIRWVKTDGDLAKGAAAANSPIPDVLDHMEAILRTITNPPYNRQGGRFGEATQYIQHRDAEALNPPVAEMVRAIWQATKVMETTDANLF
jgi:hypothetical protein